MDLVLECISIILILLMWLYILTEYRGLPEMVASHFNARGEPNDYSNKQFLLFIPAIATLMYLGLFILNRYPHIHNYKVHITEENALKNYRFSTRIVRIVNLFCMGIFTYISYQIIESTKGQSFLIGTWFLPAVITTCVLLPIFILIYFRKINKS